MEEDITGKEAVSLEQLKAYADEVRGGIPATTESYGTVKLISDDDLNVYKSGVGNGADTNNIDIEVTVNHAELVNYPENAEISYTASCVDGTVTINDLYIDTNTSGLFRPQTRYELATVQVGYRPSSLTTIDSVVLWIDGDKYSRWSFKVEVDTDGKIYLQSTDGSGYVSGSTTYTIKTPITYQVAVDPIFASVTDDTVLNIDQTLSLLSGSGDSSEGDNLSGCVELLWEGSGSYATIENLIDYACIVVVIKYVNPIGSGIIPTIDGNYYIPRTTSGSAVQINISESKIIAVNNSTYPICMIYGMKKQNSSPELTADVLYDNSTGTNSVQIDDIDSYSYIECVVRNPVGTLYTETLTAPFKTNTLSEPNGYVEMYRNSYGVNSVNAENGEITITKVTGYK